MTAMAKIQTTGENRPHRRLFRVGVLAVALSLTAASLATSAVATTGNRSGPAATTSSTCVPTSVLSPLLGSWYAQVRFLGQPFPGKTEATMMTFTPGGGLVEANGVNPSPAGNSGYWIINSDCSYSIRTLLFDWNPSNSAIKTITDVRLRFVMTDKNHFHSTSAAATVTTFDTTTGQRVGDQINVPNISETTAERFTAWTVPESFPPAP